MQKKERQMEDKSISFYLFGNHIDSEHKIEEKCHKCGAIIEDKVEHMAVCHEISFELCLWPGCYMAIYIVFRGVEGAYRDEP